MKATTNSTFLCFWIRAKEIFDLRNTKSKIIMPDPTAIATQSLQDEFAASNGSFSKQAFIGERLHIPVTRLRADLSTLLSDLKAQLIELINRDYADFINLSTNLVGLDKMISDVRVPLSKFGADVTVSYLCLI
jgi:hypothetical protein